VYEQQIQRVAEALVGAGFDVEVLCMRHPDRPRTSIVNGVTITGLPASLGRFSKLRYVFDYGWFFLLATVTLTARHIRRPYAVIQVYTMPDFLVFSAAIPKLLGSRVLAYMNEPTPELFETLYGTGGRFRRLLERIEQRVLRFADHALTVTDQLKQRYVERGARAEKITVILNAADPASGLAGWSPPENWQSDEFVVLSHGAIEDRYGQDTIVAAAGLLRAELPDLRIVFTGRGSNADELTRLIETSGLEDIVRFEGWVSRERLNDLLHTSDVGIVAQKGSAYSHLVHTYKMVDYWIFGLPVIASRLRATSDAYDDSVIEYYEPDDAADLARAIRRLHDDPARRDELAQNGKLAESRSGWGVQQQTYLRVYETLLEASPQSVTERAQS
jgi:glycosyltransferase involved in cell wall biosynthesis